MHLRVVLPVIGDQLVENIRKECEHWAAPGTTISTVTLSQGTASIESEYDEALAGPGIIERVHEAQDDNVDGIFVTCFADPGVHASRQIIDAPVVGGYEPAMLQALSLGDRIGIITVLPNVVPMLRALGRRYSIEDRVGTIRVVNLPVLELHDHDLLASRLEIQAAEAIESGEADVIVLGCTGMLGLAQSLRQRLLARGLDVPVVDPTAAAIRSLETSVLLGLSPSRTTYMAPPAKERSSATI